MRSNRTLAALSAVALGASVLAAQAPSAAPATPPAAAERSTAQVEAALEPVPPPPPTRLTLPADKPALVQSGEVSASAPAHFAVTVPAGRTVEIRIRSTDPAAAFSIFRGESAEAESGTTPADGAVGWISGTEAGGDLRIVVRTAARTASAFQLLVRIQPPEEPESAAPPAG
jgi:hypothetical protein